MRGERLRLRVGVVDLAGQVVVEVFGQLLQLGVDVGAEPRVGGGREQQDGRERQTEHAGHCEQQHIGSRYALLWTDERDLQERPSDQRCEHHRDAAQHQHRRDGERGREQRFSGNETHDRQSRRRGRFARAIAAVARLHEHPVVHTCNLHCPLGDGCRQPAKSVALPAACRWRHQRREGHRVEFVGSSSRGIHDAAIGRGQDQGVERALIDLAGKVVTQRLAGRHLHGHGRQRLRVWRSQADSERGALTGDVGAIVRHTPPPPRLGVAEVSATVGSVNATSCVTLRPVGSLVFRAFTVSATHMATSGFGIRLRVPQRIADDAHTVLNEVLGLPGEDGDEAEISALKIALLVLVVVPVSKRQRGEQNEGQHAADYGPAFQRVGAKVHGAPRGRRKRPSDA